MHAVDPLMLHEPVGQGVHCEVPVTDVNVPAGQSKQAVALEGLYDPARHCAHPAFRLVAREATPYHPEGQGWHNTL